MDPDDKPDTPAPSVSEDTSPALDMASYRKEFGSVWLYHPDTSDWPKD